MGIHERLNILLSVLFVFFSVWTSTVLFGLFGGCIILLFLVNLGIHRQYYVAKEQYWLEYARTHPAAVCQRPCWPANGYCHPRCQEERFPMPDFSEEIHDDTALSGDAWEQHVQAFLEDVTRHQGKELRG